MIPIEPESTGPAGSEMNVTPPPMPPETPATQPSAERHEPASGPTPSPATSSRQPFWTYGDLIFFLALCFPCLLVAYLFVAGLSPVLPSGKPLQQLLLLQLLWYLLIFGSLCALLRLRYHRPFWRSLAWNPLSIGAAIGSFLGGPLLAGGLGFVGFLMRTPEISLPFQQLISDRATMALTGVFVVVLGPVCEELAFRGFMMPLFTRSLGAVPGILITGFLFGLAHGYEYHWSWRHIALITVAGSVFGWARYKTGSTVAAAFLHSTFNLTQFAALLAQSRSLV